MQLFVNYSNEFFKFNVAATLNIIKIKRYANRSIKNFITIKKKLNNHQDFFFITVSTPILKQFTIYSDLLVEVLFDSRI